MVTPRLLLILAALVLLLGACAPGVYTFEVTHGDGAGVASVDRPARPVPPPVEPPSEPPIIPGPCGSTAICPPAPSPEPTPPPDMSWADRPPCSTPGGERVGWCPGPPPRAR